MPWTQVPSTAAFGVIIADYKPTVCRLPRPTRSHATLEYCTSLTTNRRTCLYCCPISGCAWDQDPCVALLTL